MNSDRNRTVDVLKGIAIIFVLFTHYEWTPEQRKIFIFPYVINMSIPIFMIISGYVYSLSQSKKEIHHLEDAYDKSILINRFIRYSVPLLVLIIWELLDPHFSISARPPLHLLKWGIDGTYGKGNYYYPVLLQLVIVFPIIYYIIETNKEKGLLICFVLNAMYELLVWAYGMNTECYRLLVFRYIFLIAAGAFAFNKYRIGVFKSILFTILGALFIYFITYQKYNTKILNSDWASTSFIASLVIVPIMIWILQNVNLHFWPLEFIGKASYHIFLVQMVYYLGYYSVLQNVFLIWQVHLLMGMVICIVAGCIFYYVDRPIQSKLKLLITRIH
ncbi:MAG: acyltransferase [Ruminococcus sp.]|nr:acyltransferase [Ruminococcus sp.]